MTCPLEYITKAEKRVWIIVRKNMIWSVKKYIDEALKKTSEGIDVRIITSDVEDLTKIVSDFELINKTTVRNLGVVNAPVSDILYIVDDKAWMEVDDKLTEVDIKEVEGKFRELWNKYRTKTLVSKAKRRVLAAIPRVGEDDTHALIEKASSGVDVYVITSDKSTLTSITEYLVCNNDKMSVYAKRLTRLKTLIAVMPALTLAILIGLSVLVFQVALPTYVGFFNNNKILDLLLVTSYTFLGALSIYVSASYAIRLNNKVTVVLEDVKRAIKMAEMAKVASERLNVLKAPVAEEFYVIDDGAWAVHDDGRLIEIDVKGAERKFVDMGFWILGS